MKRVNLMLWAFCLVASPFVGVAQTIELEPQTLTNVENTPRPVFPVPSDRQLAWNETEFYAFFHYGMNTYTNSEWGNGKENPSTFAPTAAPNPRQWLETAKKAGMKGGIAVIKHHDGFCLWPTVTTEHCVRHAGNDFGKNTDIPRDFAAAAKELNMKYGFYISPWDLNSAYWGEKDANGKYTDNYAKKVFLPQCAEAAKYGADQFEMWFDGATGGHEGHYGGTNEKRSIDNPATYYDIANLRDSIHQACPNIILWGVGGEARWIGNEAGWAGETCWSYGTGERGDETAWRWNAGESDAKATTKGWFWHPDEGIRSAEELFAMYLKTVGRNATFILNLPPDRSGALPPQTVSRMEELGALLTKRLGTDLAPEAKVTVSETRAAGATTTYEAKNLTDGNKNTCWATNDGTTSATITFEWAHPMLVRYVSMMEYIKLGQRVKGFNLETSADGVNFTRLATNVAQTTIGYKRIIPLNGNVDSSYGEGYTVKCLRINITDSKACPLLHTVQIF